MKDDAKKMAQLLRSGNTMLNQACPVCNNPIFRDKNGKVFCPVCNREIVFVDAEVKKKLQNNEESEKVQDNDSLSFLNQIIIEKINLIAQKLNSETQIDSIERYVVLLTNIFALLDKINKLKF